MNPTPDKPLVPNPRNYREVRRMFSAISGKYDRLNRLLSLHLDAYWRGRLVRNLSRDQKNQKNHHRHPLLILDLCCGTGELALSVSRGLPSAARIVALDFSRPMLRLGMEKFRKEETRLSRQTPPVSGPRFLPVEGDALRLPLQEERFDAVVVAFGLRNLGDPAAGLGEIWRILKPGGRLYVLEFSQPRNKIMRGLFRVYLGGALSGLGNWLTRSRAYDYLALTIQGFAPREEVCSWIRIRGFQQVRHQSLTGGVVVLYEGMRPSRGDEGIVAKAAASCGVLELAGSNTP
jgi:demethylmenaquinone methyltransferase/2-methoxy-6-polyprenyl-1,4-benzoquinol methylase